MKNQKHNYENLSSPVNTFKLTSRPVELRTKYTHAQIQFLKSKFFWLGFATGGVLLTLSYIAMDIFLELAK